MNTATAPSTAEFFLDLVFEDAADVAGLPLGFVHFLGQ